MSKLSSIYYLEVSLHHTVQWTYIKNNQYPHMSSNIEQFKKESNSLYNQLLTLQEIKKDKNMDEYG